MNFRMLKLPALVSIAVSVIAGCAGGGSSLEFKGQAVYKNVYDGQSDDLLTAGLGASGLAKPAAPAPADPKAPTAAELRRMAIHGNYRAIVPTAPGTGYGVLFGPQVGVDGKVVTVKGADGKDVPAEGKIAGEEYLTYADNGTGKQNVTLMVQVPASFDPKNACIIAGPSSGSRGVYGAIGTAGEWGLKRGCAVAYSDVGKGMGIHDLASDTVHRIDGTRGTATEVGKASHFTANLSAAEREAYNKANPNRIAFKHAHSQQNPEKDWGKFTLEAVELAFQVLNTKGYNLTPANTLVIASSVSNGGYSSLMAAEQDTKGLIDGVAVSEPNVSIKNQPFTVNYANNAPVANPGRPLIDYYSLWNLYVQCAAMTSDSALSDYQVKSPIKFSGEIGMNRCKSLADKGLLKTKFVADQAEEARGILRAYGLTADQEGLQNTTAALSFHEAITTGYANSYGRFSVADNLCGYSYAGTIAPAKDASGKVTNAADIGKPGPFGGLAASFASLAGVYPGGGINLINNNAKGGPLENRSSVTASTDRKDGNLDGAICLRNLVLGRDIVTGKPLAGKDLDNHKRIMQGLGETIMTGNLQGKPTIVIVPRNDQVIAPNHAGRAYFGLNKMVEGAKSKLAVVEVTNAQHLDSLNGLPGYNDKLIPTHVYFDQAMNLMWDHLKNGKPLPGSQVVRTAPPGMSGDKANAVAKLHVPNILIDVPEYSRITFDGKAVTVPR